MTREQTIECIKVMQAFVDGKEVEVQLPAGNWETMAPNWNWRDTVYRIKPTPVLRPWTADEVPLGAWMRSRGLIGRQIITHTAEEEDRAWWLKASEHSTDGGKTWLPCGVVEEAK
jgi:hypothetical protein